VTGALSSRFTMPVAIGKTASPRRGHGNAAPAARAASSRKKVAWARGLAALDGAGHLDGAAEQQQFLRESGLAGRRGCEMIANVRRRAISGKPGSVMAIELRARGAWEPRRASLSTARILATARPPDSSRAGYRPARSPSTGTGGSLRLLEGPYLEKKRRSPCPRRAGRALDQGAEAGACPRRGSGNASPTHRFKNVRLARTDAHDSVTQQLPASGSPRGTRTPPAGKSRKIPSLQGNW